MQGVDTDTVHEAVGLAHGDIYMTLRCRVVSIHDTLLRHGIKSNCIVTTHHIIRGRAAIAFPRGVGLQCGLAVGAVHDGS